MKNDFIFPILALSLICLVMTAALAFVNDVTQPVIEEAAYHRATQAMRDIIPLADGFVEIELTDMPVAVSAAYKATNDTGYIFIVNTRGFGGEMRIMSGVCNDGNFMGSSVLHHYETINFANKVFAVRDDYEERGLSLLEADVITGATMTFNAYQHAIQYAHEAFAALRGLSNE